jgi:hypothetical protein
LAFGQVDGKNEDKDCTNKENNFGLTIDQFINILHLQQNQELLPVLHQ